MFPHPPPNLSASASPARPTEAPQVSYSHTLLRPVDSHSSAYTSSTPQSPTKTSSAPRQLPLPIRDMGNEEKGGGESEGEAARPPSKTAELDRVLASFGFEFDVVSPSLVSGRLRVTESCCQPFKVLHGGVSALLAEALASLGAHVASGFRRVAGVQLSINHLKAAPLGSDIAAEATPASVGRTVQVWDVQLWKIDPSTAKKGIMIASSRVTLLSNLPVPEFAKEAEATIRRHAKL